MNLKSKVLTFFVLIPLFFIGVVEADEASNYKLLPGDRLAISVWGEDTLNIKDVVVLPDGMISFPLVGGLQVKEMTSAQVSALLAEKLKEFLPEPQVTVIVTGVEGHKAYVLGKVSKPGPILINSPMTILQALSLAGVLDRFAEEESIKLIRSTPEGQKVYPINYKKLVRGLALETNIELKAGDTILVP